MSTSLAFTLSLIWMFVLFGATIFNYLKDRQRLFTSGAFILFMYAIAHVANTLWLATLPFDELIGVHYLFFAAASLITAAGLFFINKQNPRVMINITIALLVVEVFMGYGVHVDRNFLALNGAIEPNVTGASKWWLWDALSYLSFANTFTVFLAITLPRVYQVKNEEDPDKDPVALAVNKAVKAYLEKFKEGSRIKARAKVYLDYSFEGLCSLPVDGSQEFHTEVGIELLNKAIRTCCYEPGRTKPVGLFGRFIYWLRS